MCDIDLETCSVFSETQIKARKPHVCDCCGGPIKPGEHYQKHFSVFDGYPTSEKSCLACVEMTSEFTKVHGQYSNPSYMPELLQECIDNERGEDEAMVQKWTSELKAMEKRRAPASAQSC